VLISKPFSARSHILVGFQVYSYYKTFPMPITSHKFGSIDPITGQETNDDNQQFVSSVCWRGRSNMVVAANSSGSIKVLELVWTRLRGSYRIFHQAFCLENGQVSEQAEPSERQKQLCNSGNLQLQLPIFPWDSLWIVQSEGKKSLGYSERWSVFGRHFDIVLTSQHLKEGLGLGVCTDLGAPRDV
jgi:hypothetical protein